MSALGMGIQCLPWYPLTSFHNYRHKQVFRKEKLYLIHLETASWSGPRMTEH